MSEHFDAIVEASNSGVTAWGEGMENVTLIRGHARFEGPRSISVKGETLSAERIPTLLQSLRPLRL